MRGWRGAPEEQEFLREVFVGACRYFNTVLGPGADMFHHDHFHLDLARHDPRGQRHVCKPILKFTPRLGDGAVAADPKARTAGPPLQQHPIDIEADDDPFAVGAAPARTPAGSRSSIQSYASTPRPAHRTPGRPAPSARLTPASRSCPRVLQPARIASRSPTPSVRCRSMISCRPAPTG